MAGASRKGGLGPSSLGFYIRGNPVHPGMMMVVMMNSTSEGSWAHRGWSWWPIWPWYWPWACRWWSYWPWCCPYDDVVDHVNAGGDDVKVRRQERGRVESAELERGNPGTSGLHPIHTRTTSLCRICHKYIHGRSFQLFVWGDDRKHNGGSTSWHLDKDVYTSIKFHVQKNFPFHKCSPLCVAHKCPAMTCGPKALGEYTPAAVCRRGKIYIWENAYVSLEGLGACCVEGGRGRLMRAEGLCPTIISATCTYIGHLSRLAGCWSNVFLVAAMSIILRSKLLLRSSQCLVWCVNVEAFWLLADLRGLYSNNSDRALWGHIATGWLSAYTRWLHNIRW